MLIHELDAPPPHEAHARLAARSGTTFILESREGPKRMARYSFVGFDPVGTVSYDDALAVRGALPAPSRDQDPLTYLRRIQAFYHTDDHDAPFVGGLVGSIGYDFVRHVEPSLERPGDTWPRFLFGLYLDGLVYDHVEGTCTYVSRGEDRIDAVRQALAASATDGALHIGPVQALVDRASYTRQVGRAQELIRAGEAFQIVLSRPYQATRRGDLGPLYAWLREREAVPYLYYLRFGDRELLGASPEMLVRVRSGIVETFPIAGTRPLSGDEAADAAAGADLLADPKETAEHAMLVDLARNDVGKVALHGSVEVADFQALHRFRNVQHLVSHVRGRLADDKDPLDALAAIFPAGTVSGAPKVRAMEHIDAIETMARGPYAGAVAYLSFNGDFDSAIAIRSLSAEGEQVKVQAGAGIVLESDPDREFEETRHKANTLLQALEQFGATLPREDA